MATSSRGAFILFEGVDRCGKTTQGSRLVERLKAQGHDADFVRFPDRTTAIGKIINQYLTKEIELEDHAVHLLFTANRWECSQRLINGLKAGKHMVVDRYSHSGIAFSAAKPGLDFEWCSAPETGLPAPDVVIFLQIDAESASSRGGFGQERYEHNAFQKIVRGNFAKLQNSGWRLVNAAGTIEEVGAVVESIAAEAIKAAANAPIETLWRGDEGSAPGHTAAGTGDAAALAAEKAAAAQLIRGCKDAAAEASAEDEESKAASS